MFRSIALFLVAFFVLSAPASAAGTRYDIKAEIEPPAGTISVQGDIDTVAAGPQLRFALHRTFEITKLTVNGKKAGFSYESTGPFPNARFVTVTLPEGAAGKPVRLSIAYHGALEKIPEWGAAPDQKFGMDDQINPKLVYLAVYSFWYPVLGPYGETFETNLEVSLPEGWTAVSGGDLHDLGTANGRTIRRWSVKKNFDIALSASASYRRIATNDVELYYVQMPEPVVRAEAKNLSDVMTLFRDKLGATVAPGGVVRHVYAPLRYGQGRAGIARPGLIITSEGRVLDAMAADPRYTLFQDVAHEIAHFWWNFGSGQGDWINEAFAEYFSALAVRELVSEAEFNSALERYRKGVAGLPKDAPSLATVPKDGNYMIWTVRYQKGSLMLDAVRQAMGDKAFFAAARDFFQTYKNRNIDTAEFRTFWGARLGEKKAMLNGWLDNGGGLSSP